MFCLNVESVRFSNGMLILKIEQSFEPHYFGYFHLSKFAIYIYTVDIHNDSRVSKESYTLELNAMLHPLL